MSALPITPPAEFVPGVYDDISHTDYLAIDALSSSGIKRLLQSPAHYRWDRENPSASTPSMAVGTALHMGILEPDRFDSGAIAVIPDDAPNRPSLRQVNAAKPGPATIAAIDWWERFDSEAAGRLVLTEAQMGVVEGMVSAIRRHPIFEEIADGHAEHSLLWNDARHGDGVPCKARFDYLRSDGVAFDLKSCVDASPDGFARSVASFRYHYQAAWYNNGHEHLLDRSLAAFIFIAVENTAPYGVGTYVLPSNALMFGADRCEEAMLLYAQARKTGYWRGYPEKVLPLHLPRWATTINN